MAPEALSYWRVELENGKVASVREVESIVNERNHRVFYVEAPSADAARNRALIRYQTYLANQRQQINARRAKNKAAGNCRCGAKVPPHRESCDKCNKQSADSMLRAQARVRGEPVVLPPKSEAFAKGKEEREREIRLSVLDQVHMAWIRSKDTKDFTQWLLSEKARLKREKAA